MVSILENLCHQLIYVSPWQNFNSLLLFLTCFTTPFPCVLSSLRSYSSRPMRQCISLEVLIIARRHYLSQYFIIF